MTLAGLENLDIPLVPKQFQSAVHGARLRLVSYWGDGSIGNRRVIDRAAVNRIQRAALIVSHADADLTVARCACGHPSP